MSMSCCDPRRYSPEGSAEENLTHFDVQVYIRTENFIFMNYILVKFQ